jgi:hypothetical protein
MGMAERHIDLGMTIKKKYEALKKWHSTGSQWTRNLESN